MAVFIIPEFSEKLFPAPSEVEVRLYGDFDYRSIYEQARQVMAGADLEWQGSIYHLKNPTKDLLLKLYVSTVSLEEYKRKLSLKKIEWEVEEASITLTPWELRIEYTGKEPECVANLIEAIATKDMIVKITARRQAR